MHAGLARLLRPGGAGVGGGVLELLAVGGAACRVQVLADAALGLLHVAADGLQLLPGDALAERVHPGVEPRLAVGDVVQRVLDVAGDRLAAVVLTDGVLQLLARLLVVGLDPFLQRRNPLPRPARVVQPR